VIPEPYYIRDSRNGSIRLRQNHDSGRQFITIQGEICNGPWDKRKKLPKDGGQASRLINIVTRLKKFERILLAKGVSNPPLSLVWAEQFKSVDEEAPQSNKVMDWCAWKASLSGIHYKRGFLNIIAHLEDWGRPNALLVDINETWIKKYCEYLSNKRGLRTSSITKSIAYLRNVLDSAVRNNQPIGNIPDRLTRSTVGGKPSEIRQPLDFSEVMAIHDLTKLPRHLVVVRDCFLLMCFTGVRVSDLLDNSWNISRDRIVNRQHKTQGIHVITLNEYSKQIISRYSTVGLNGIYKLELPAFTGQYLNRALKKLAIMARIKKPVHNHIARHTFARILADMGVNENLRGAELGHNSRKSVTAGYGIIDAEFQVKLVGKKWAKAISQWKGDYEKWYEAVNS